MTEIGWTLKIHEGTTYDNGGERKTLTQKPREAWEKKISQASAPTDKT